MATKSELLQFDFTDYYQNEMGTGLVRSWVGFEKPVMPDRLAQIKLTTNEMEQRFLDEHGNRRLNLDPGILSLHNLVLASTKDYAHRICLADGIYAELTLIYRSGGYRALEWTYPDYQTETCGRFLAESRDRLVEKQKRLLTSPGTSG